MTESIQTSVERQNCITAIDQLFENWSKKLDDATFNILSGFRRQLSFGKGLTLNQINALLSIEHRVYSQEDSVSAAQAQAVAPTIAITATSNPCCGGRK